MRRPIFGIQAAEVFTPRKHSVNPQMYVHRPNLEKQVLRAARGSKHFCIFGESGNGKSWLYKHVFDTSKIQYTTLNLSKAVVLGSIYEAIKDKVRIPGASEPQSRSVSRDYGLKPGGIGVEGTTTSVSRVEPEDPIKKLFHLVKGTQRFPSIIVFDNFEMIVGKKNLIEELSNLIVMLDDDDYGDFNVRFCFVGVPSEIRDYLAHQGSRSTIMTRVTEIDEVSRMRPTQARQILESGFERLLKLRFLEQDRRDLVYDRLISVSDRIAIEIQALGLEVAIGAQENDGYIEDLLVMDAIDAWLLQSHNSIRQTILERLNSEKNGRRSQVLYCLGKCDTEDFTVTDVREIFRFEFGVSSTGKPVDVSRHLRALSSGINPPIRKTKNGSGYRFVNPKYRMAVRALLEKNSDQVFVPKNKL